MPIGGITPRTTTTTSSNNKPPWVKEATTDSAPSWTQRKLKPVDSKVEAKSTPEPENALNHKPLKPTIKKQTAVKEEVSPPTENGVTDEKLVKPSERLAKQPSEKVQRNFTIKPKTNDTKKTDEKVNAAKPPAPEKSPSKSRVAPRKPSLAKQNSREDMPPKKWRDPLHERVKEGIDKTLNNEVPKGHTLTKNESLRSLLKPVPPPMPPPMPPKMPPPPEFKKDPVSMEKIKKLEQLKSRPRRRPDWSDMMKEVEQGKKLKKVVCNDRSSPIITTASVVKNKGQFIFESEKEMKHNELLKEIHGGVKLKKTKTNDRSKPNLEGLRKFRRQMTIEEQLQKSMSQANISGDGVEEAPIEVADVDDMDDIDKVRDDLQSTKQLLAIELRNKEAQERENKRLLSRIQNLEAEIARERAIIKQEQQKTVISVTDAYDERLVVNLKNEVERAKLTADDLEKKYLAAAEDRDTYQSELEELKRKNAELEKKLQQALSGIMPSNASSRRSSHAIKQMSLQKESSFEEEEEESSEEEEESEEKKQKRMEREVKNMRNKIRHLKEKQDNQKRERMALKMSLKNQKDGLKEEKKKYKALKREVDKMAALMKEAGSDDDEDEEPSQDKSEGDSDEVAEESESETDASTEEETESESEPEDAPIVKKKENLQKRLKRHEARCAALKKGNHLLTANVDRLKDDVNKQRDKAVAIKKELDSLVEDFA